MNDDAQAIRELVENWGVWRDAGGWEAGQRAIGYRHLAYIQTRIGYDVKRDMPGLIGPEVEALYARGAAWLAGPGGADPARDA